MIGAAFGLAVYNKMQKMTVNKDSVKGKAKEVAGNVVGNEKMQAEGTLDQVVGASKEVLMDFEKFCDLCHWGWNSRQGGW